ncbi:MAG: ATP-binding protein [Kiritimatiellia bacterium]
MNILRHLHFPDETFFLWGPRQSGKTTLLKARLPDAFRIDLLRTDERMRYARNPSLLRETVRPRPVSQWIVIDEIQKVPELLDEVHYLMQEDQRRFALCGSSARKLRRSHANLLGGRALRRELLGLSAHEIGAAFELDRMLNHGTLPTHYLSPAPQEKLAAYVDLYLKEEILEEGLTRNLPVFWDFLRAAAIGDTEVTNFSNIGRECGVTSATVRSYYEILQDTLIGTLLPAFTRRARRRVQHAPKFYFHDVGVVNHLVRRHRVEPGSDVFGKTFENWIFHELSVHRCCQSIPYDLSYWRLSSGIEVDFVLGDADVAIEVKGKARIQSNDWRHLLEFRREYPQVGRLIIVSLEPYARITDEGVHILPWQDFLQNLWQGTLIPDTPTPC